MNKVNKSANEYFLTRTQFETRKNAGTLEIGAVYHITDDQNSIKVYTTETMSTSTLPAQTVPKLTKAQIDTIHTLLSQGKYVMVDDGNGQYVVSESDNLYEEIRFTYMGMYLGYYLEGNNAVVNYTYVGVLGTNDGTNWTGLTIGGVTKALGGGGIGSHLYRHSITFASPYSRYSVSNPLRCVVYNDSSEQFDHLKLINYISSKGYCLAQGIVVDTNNSTQLFADVVTYSTELSISMSSADGTVKGRLVGVSFSTDNVLQIF